MNTCNFLVCYDISDKKRLAKIARLLSKIAIRIQKSIFLYLDCNKIEISKLVDELNLIINDKEDDIRIYRIDINQSINLNSGIDLKNPNIIKE